MKFVLKFHPRYWYNVCILYTYSVFCILTYLNMSYHTGRKEIIKLSLVRFYCLYVK